MICSSLAFVQRFTNLRIVQLRLKRPTLDHNDLKYFSPVSNLSFLSKIIEKENKIQMLDHLSSNSLLNPFQYACKSGRSTEITLLEIVQDFLLSLHNGNICVVMFLDLSAVLDTADHNILLSRIAYVSGIYGAPQQWFSSYLSNIIKDCFHQQLFLTVFLGALYWGLFCLSCIPHLALM